MTILALDSSGPACSAAVWRDGALVSLNFLQNGNTHSVNLMPLVEQTLENCALTLDGVDFIACVTGPGSFTGVRIGVSAARAMSLAINIPCIEINALEALAFRSYPGTICPILDARRAQVYCGAFYGGKRLKEDAAMPLDDFLEIVETLPKPYLFIGDGASAYAQEISSKLGENAVIAAESERFLSAGNAAALAATKTGESINGRELLPYYLRAPQAEREFAEKESAKK